MTVLTDAEIENEVKFAQLGITPFNPLMIQPTSYDITLGDEFRLYRWPTDMPWAINATTPIIDTKRDVAPMMELIEVQQGSYFDLQPHTFALASSIEAFRFPAHIVGRLEGKSSLARLGLIIHTTAGFFDPGFEGYATLELFNVAPFPIRLYPGMKIGQMSFQRLAAKARRPYGRNGLDSKYQGQRGPTASRYHENFARLPDGG